MNVCIVGGSGYVGLITGLGLAELGHRVVNVDIDAEKLELLRRGRSPVYEEGVDLEALLRRNLDAGRIEFTADLDRGVRQAQVVFIAVGTPERGDRTADLSQVIGVAEELVKYLDGYTVIVIKSTVPVGTVELVGSILRREGVEGKDFDIVANPEFLREGKGLYDFFRPTRIVIGANSERARAVMRELYAPFLGTKPAPDGTLLKPRPDTPLIETDLASAQMIKYASNAFLATKISFINEIASICERVGADVKEVTKGMGYDPRIGHEYLEAGLGFGGPCLEKDLKALIKIAEQAGYEPRLLSAVLEKNDHQVRQVIVKLKELIGYLLYNKIIAVFGLAFKAGTNDVRASLSLRVIDQLEKEGAILRAYDPVAIPEAKKVKSGIEYCEDPYEAVRQAEALLILTDWPEFRTLDYGKIKGADGLPLHRGRTEHPRRSGFAGAGVYISGHRCSMNLLVTGCAGFIGWKVSEVLLQAGHTVVGVDNLNDAYDTRLKEWRLRQLQGHPNFRFHRLDITDRAALQPLFVSPSAPPFDAVINLAARAGVRQSLEDPWAYYATNVTGTLNLLELCRQHGVGKFVLASTSSVYGTGERPFREDRPTDRPLSPYAASKKAAEALAYTYHHLYGLDVTVLRYFTVYSPAGRPDMSIFRFVKWISEGEPLLLYGDGSQERDFTYVDDIARGTVAALKPLGFEVINLGSDRPVPVKDVIGLIEEMVGRKARVERRPAHPADVPATWAHIEKARRLLDWAPTTPLETGLRQAIEWYRQNRTWAKDVKV